MRVHRRGGDRSTEGTPALQLLFTYFSAEPHTPRAAPRRVSDPVLDLHAGRSALDLRERIHRTRWPDQVPGIGWAQGTERQFLHGLLADWADFDWRAQGRRRFKLRIGVR